MAVENNHFSQAPYPQQALHQFNQQWQCDLKILGLERSGEGLKKITLASSMLM